MKICLINNLYQPFDRGGGSEQVCANLANGLQDLGHQVIIISTLPKRQTPPDLAGQYYLPSNFSQLGHWSKLRRLLWHIWSMFNNKPVARIKEILQTEQPDLIISHNLMGLSYRTARLAKYYHNWVHILHDIQLLHPAGLIYYQQEGIIHTWLAKVYQNLNKRNFQFVKLAISPSQWLLNLHQAQGLFLNNGLQLANPQNWLDNKTIIKEKPVIFQWLTVSQLVKHKGLNLLLTAWQELSKTTDNIKLTIVGTGPLAEIISQQAKQLSNIELTGKLDNKQVQQLMKRANCLIVPSLCYENSPTVIYEAYQNNLLAIGSDLGGLAELLPERCRYAVNNSEALVQKMRSVMNNYLDYQQIWSDYREQIKPPSVAQYLKIILEKIK